MNTRKNSLVVMLFLCLASTAMLRAQTLEYIQAFIDKDCYLTGEQIQVHVSVTDAQHKPMGMSKVAYVELCDIKSIQAQCMVQLTDGEGWASIDLPGSMHSGNYQMNVYTRYMRNFGQDCYYKRMVSVVNLLNPSADDDIEFIDASPEVKAATSDYVLTDKKQYGAREKVVFSMPDVNGRSFTLSVVRKDCVAAANSRQQENPKYNTDNGLSYIPELDGHIVNAKTIDGKKPTTSRIGLVGKAGAVFDGQIQKDGSVRFYTMGLNGSLPMSLNGYTFDAQPVHMEFVQPYEKVLPETLPTLKVYYNESDLKDRSISAQIEKSKRDISLGTVIEHKKSFMGVEPDLFYDLDEWTKFMTVREILIEFVAGVRVRNIENRKALYTLDPEANGYSKWAALVLLDGMPVTDIDALMDYDARRLKFVQIYKGRFQFGESPCQGVISFISRKGSLQDFLLDEGTQIYTYDFPQDRPAFISPVYEDKSSRQPDFRHTLYFDAAVSGQREFYTSDLPGTYEVRLQYVGLDDHEHLISSEFEVK